MHTIRRLRIQRGWTQYELAIQVGVQPQAVYLWESGRRSPQVAQMRKLGKLFEICSDDIVLSSEDSSPPGGESAQDADAAAVSSEDGRAPVTDA